MVFVPRLVVNPRNACVAGLEVETSELGDGFRSAGQRFSKPIGRSLDAWATTSISSGEFAMTQRDLSTIKRKLEKQLQNLEDRAQRIETRLSDPGSPDWEENALLHEDDEVLSALSEKAEGDIHEIRLALKRIAEGTYGSCVRCHSPISIQRLEALPFTANCVACASHR